MKSFMFIDILQALIVEHFLLSSGFRKYSFSPMTTLYMVNVLEL